MGACWSTALTGTILVLNFVVYLYGYHKNFSLSTSVVGAIYTKTIQCANAAIPIKSDKNELKIVCTSQQLQNRQISACF